MSVKSNVDMKLMVDNRLCEMYITKYCTKSETDSDHLSFIKNQILNCSEEVTQYTKLAKYTMKLMSNRDFSSQEVAFLLNNNENENELFRTNVQFLYINMNERYVIRNRFRAQNSTNDE